MLSRQIAELGIYPAVDPLDSTSRQLDPLVVGLSIMRLHKVFKEYCSVIESLKILLPF